MYLTNIYKAYKKSGPQGRKLIRKDIPLKIIESLWHLFILVLISPLIALYLPAVFITWAFEKLGKTVGYKLGSVIMPISKKRALIGQKWRSLHAGQ